MRGWGGDDRPVFLVGPQQRSMLVKMMTGVDVRPHETNDPIRKAVRIAILDAVQRDLAGEDEPDDDL